MASHRNSLARVVDSNPFTVVVVATITVNAVVLGLQIGRGDRGALGRTAECAECGLRRRVHHRARYPDRLLLAAAVGVLPNGWNIFDFIVIGATFVPGVAENSTPLRLVRLLRVVRLVRVLPDLRILLLGVWRSVPRSA